MNPESKPHVARHRRATVSTKGRVLAATGISVAAWTSAFLVIRSLRESFDPGALALGRLIIGSFALGAVLLGRARWVAPSRSQWGLLALCGVSWFAAYNVALNAGERQLEAGTAAMLVNVGPILIALLASRLLGEPLRRGLMIGAAIAFTGAALIGIATSARAPGDLGGVLLCLSAATAYAVGVTAQKVILRELPPLQVTQIACAIGALCCLPFIGELSHDLRFATGAQIAGMLYLGLVPTALAFGTWAYALTHVSAGRLSITTYLVPPLTILAGWPLLDERPPTLALLGGLLALAGVALAGRAS